MDDVTQIYTCIIVQKICLTLYGITKPSTSSHAGSAAGYNI